METRKKFDRNHPPFGSIVNRERKSSWWNKFIKGEQSSSAPMAGGSEELNFCLLYVPYINQEVIKLCKKLIYSYSTRLAFHMPGFYLLTIFNYFIVVPASGELPFTYSWNLQLKHQSVTCWVKYNKWYLVPAPGSPFARKAGWRLGLPYLLSLSGLVCLLLFTFVLVLAFCSVEHAFEFRFVASSLAVVFVSALNCVCLHTFV